MQSLPNLYSSIALAAVVAVSSFFGGWQVNGWRLNSKITELKLHYDTMLKEAEDKALATESHWAAMRDNIIDEAQEKEIELENIISAERRTVNSLRSQLSDYIQRTRDTPSNPSSPSKFRDDPIGMLANVLAEVDETASTMAGYADRLKAAGSLCERSYDALREP